MVKIYNKIKKLAKLYEKKAYEQLDLPESTETSPFSKRNELTSEEWNKSKEEELKSVDSYKKFAANALKKIETRINVLNQYENWESDLDKNYKEIKNNYKAVSVKDYEFKNIIVKNVVNYIVPKLPEKLKEIFYIIFLNETTYMFVDSQEDDVINEWQRLCEALTLIAEIVDHGIVD